MIIIEVGTRISLYSEGDEKGCVFEILVPGVPVELGLSLEEWKALDDEQKRDELDGALWEQVRATTYGSMWVIDVNS